MPALPTFIGVVPILVSAAAPALPAIVAGLVTFISLVARPRELIALCARRPRLVAVLGCVIVAVVLVWLGTRAGAVSEPGTDWAAVAREIIENERADRDEQRPFQPIGVLDRRGFAASRYDGGRAPEKLSPAWSFSSEGTMFLASATAGEGRVYGASALVDAGGTFGSIFCLDAQTGKPVWEIEEIDGRDLKGIYSSPVLSEDGRSLIVGEGLHYDKDCALICLDAGTGRLRWRIAVPFHIESSPAIFRDIVVAGVGAIERPGHAPATGDGFMICVRISDGTELWRYPVIDAESSPAISEDGLVYIGSGNGGNAILALRIEPDDALEGRPRLVWETPAPYPITGPITIAGEILLAGGGRGDLVRRSSEPAGAVVALDRRTGRILWETELPDAVLGGISTDGTRAFCPVRNGELVALDLRDGRPLWRQRIAGAAPMLSMPVLAAGRLYAVSGDGVLAVLDSRDGRILDRQLVNAADNPGRKALSLSSPLVAGGRVFVGSETGGMRCFSEPSN